MTSINSSTPKIVPSAMGSTEPVGKLKDAAPQDAVVAPLQQKNHKASAQPRPDAPRGQRAKSDKPGKTGSKVSKSVAIAAQVAPPTTALEVMQAVVGEVKQLAVQSDASLLLRLLDQHGDVSTPSALRSCLDNHLRELEGHLATRITGLAPGGLTDCTGFAHGVMARLPKALADSQLASDVSMTLVHAKNNAKAKEHRGYPNEAKYEHVAVRCAWQEGGEKRHAVIDATLGAPVAKYDPTRLEAEGIGKNNTRYAVRERTSVAVGEQQATQKLLRLNPNEPGEKLSTYPLDPMQRSHAQDVEAALHGLADPLYAESRSFNLSMYGKTNAEQLRVGIVFPRESPELARLDLNIGGKAVTLDLSRSFDVHGDRTLKASVDAAIDGATLKGNKSALKEKAWDMLGTAALRAGADSQYNLLWQHVRSFNQLERIFEEKQP